MEKFIDFLNFFLGSSHDMKKPKQENNEINKQKQNHKDSYLTSCLVQSLFHNFHKFNVMPQQSLDVSLLQNLL